LWGVGGVLSPSESSEGGAEGGRGGSLGISRANGGLANVSMYGALQTGTYELGVMIRGGRGTSAASPDVELGQDMLIGNDQRLGWKLGFISRYPLVGGLNG
jgi:hypothetical protein